MITTRQIGAYTELSADGYLHLKGSETYAKKLIMLPSQTLEDYEEVDTLPKFTNEEYKAKVEEAVRQKYSLSDELSILRQRDTKSQEYAEYFAYVEQCKRNIKEQ